MALVVKDRVKETTTTTSTGAYTLAGAVTGFQSFAVIGDGNTTYYAISDGVDWEVGIGTYTASGTTLSRDTILESSNSGSAVNWGAGVKDIFVTYPAERSVYLNSAGSAVDVLDIGTLGTSTANITTANITAGTVSTTPTSDTDIANKIYVDNLVSTGIHFHTPVRVESPTALTVTYNNGTSGVGATLTNAGAQAALVIDGVTLSVNDRVLIYTQTNQTQNGIYTVTNVGSGSTNWVLTRATDADSYGLASPDTLGEGSTVFVQQGVTGAGETYTCNTPGTITFGTTNITFAQISSAQIYSAGTGLTLTGTQFSVTTNGITDALLRQSTALTVIGRSANSTGNVADISAGTDHQVLRRSGTTLGFGAVDLAQSAAITGTLPVGNGGTGITAFGTGVAAALGQNVSGSNGIALTTSPVFTTPNLGTPSAATLTNATGLPLSTGVTGTLPVANGGTGQTTYTNGQLLIGNTTGNTLTKATLTAGTGILITNGTGSITVAATNNGTVTSVAVSGGTTGLTTSGGPITSSGTITLAGTLAVANGGTGATTNTNARTNLGATTLGSNLFTITNPGAVTFPRFNADDSVSSLSAPDFRTAIGAGTGSVTSVAGTGSVNGITLSGTVTSSGNLTLGGTLSGVSLTTQVTGTLPIANGGSGQTTAQAAMNAFAGAVTSGSYLRGNGTNVVMSTIQAADVPTLNQNTTGSAATLTTARTIQTNLASTSAASFNGSANITPGVTGTLPASNGGTGVTTSTGSGSNVLSTSPTLVTPVLGTPASGTLSNCTVDGTNSVGYLNIPQVSQSAAYTLVSTDSGKHILHPSADTTARTFTIPANSSVPFAIGTAITFVNQNGAGTLTIAITTDTMRLAGAGTTGSRTLAANGVATAIKLTSTEWIISGVGLT